MSSTSASFVQRSPSISVQPMALLRNEVRFASVEVTSEELLAMCISRRDFESQRFHELVPDGYR